MPFEPSVVTIRASHHGPEIPIPGGPDRPPQEPEAPPPIREPSIPIPEEAPPAPGPMIPNPIVPEAL
ncbi:hypothetical protein [Plastoroseomonas arctica]|uniref:Uncharacterized protein n=1 Tax=Plastoroseomonas arctica TaxID=1509237 RepID=A0AAF1K6E8_9PROT|nr:hypothetical protein [Plastoroseomonas arctica]MBR0657294.1 hypothetical protein [Plastoroseomonas arctica]